MARRANRSTSTSTPAAAEEQEQDFDSILQTTYNLSSEDLLPSDIEYNEDQDDYPTHKSKIQKLVDHSFSSAFSLSDFADKSDSDSKNPHMAVILSFQRACILQNRQLTKLEGDIIGKDQGIAQLKMSVAERKSALLFTNFIQFATKMPELKKSSFIAEFKKYGGFLSKKYMEATPKGLADHHFDHKCPLASWCFDIIFNKLQSQLTSLSDINRAKLEQHKGLFTNGNLHPFNNDEKKKELWKELGPHLVSQFYQKRNTVAENMRHAMGMCQIHSCSFSSFNVPNPIHVSFLLLLGILLPHFLFFQPLPLNPVLRTILFNIFWLLSSPNPDLRNMPASNQPSCFYSSQRATSNADCLFSLSPPPQLPSPLETRMPLLVSPLRE